MLTKRNMGDVYIYKAGILVQGETDSVNQFESSFLKSRDNTILLAHKKLLLFCCIFHFFSQQSSAL